MGSKEIINTPIGFEEYQIPIPKEVSRSRGSMALSAITMQKINQFQAKHNL